MGWECIRQVTWLRYVTKTAKENMSKAHIVKQVAQLDKDGNVIAVWNGSKTASKALGIPFQNISECVNHKGYRKTAGEYVWRYVNELSIPVL